MIDRTDAQLDNHDDCKRKERNCWSSNSVRDGGEEEWGREGKGRPNRRVVPGRFVIGQLQQELHGSVWRQDPLRKIERCWRPIETRVTPRISRSWNRRPIPKWFAFGGQPLLVDGLTDYVCVCVCPPPMTDIHELAAIIRKRTWVRRDGHNPNPISHLSTSKWFWFSSKVLGDDKFICISFGASLFDIEISR